MSQEENTEVTNNGQMVNQFYFELSFKTKGLVSTYIDDADKLKEQMQADFAEIYGVDGFTLDVVRLATPEEIDGLKQQAAEMEAQLADDSSDVTVPEIEPTTIN
jgi:UTP:GlnB (protein PII) uridylyltransferase